MEKAEKDKKPKIIILASIVIIILGAFYIKETLKYESTDDAYVETTAVQIAPKVSGEIIEVFVEDNQSVKEGDLIARIDDRDYKIKVEQAQAAYEMKIQDQKNAKANHSAVKSQVNLAKSDLERYQNLYSEGAVSKQELDIAQTKYDNITANMVNANEALMTENSTSVADAQIKELKARKDQAELYLSYTNIYAPIDGTITGKRVIKGMYVNPGSPLLTIVPNDVWIIANYKENQLEHIKEGQRVDIKIDTYPSKKFEGIVDSIQMASGAKSSMFPPENAVGSFVKIVQRIPVKIKFTGNYEEYKIIPGMSVVPKVKIK